MDDSKLSLKSAIKEIVRQNISDDIDSNPWQRDIFSKYEGKKEKEKEKDKNATGRLPPERSKIHVKSLCADAPIDPILTIQRKGGSEQLEYNTGHRWPELIYSSSTNQCMKDGGSEESTTSHHTYAYAHITSY